MKHSLSFLSIILGTITILVFSIFGVTKHFNYSTTGNLNANNASPSTAKIFQYDENKKNTPTYDWWNKAINTSYKNSFSSNYIQNSKYDFRTNPLTKLSQGYGLVNNSFDWEWFSGDKTDTNTANEPAFNSEYNGYYQGERNDIFGMSFGLVGNLNYSLQTKSETNQNSSSWKYNFNAGGGGDFLPSLSDSNQGDGAPVYSHGDTTSSEYGTAYKEDFAYFQLWRHAVNNPGSPNQEDPRYDDNAFNQLSLIGHPNGNTIPFLEQPFSFTKEGIDFSVISFIVPQGTTDVIYNEYLRSDEPRKIFMSTDTLFNKSIKFENKDVWENDGYQFAWYMYRPWNSVPPNDDNLANNWYNYLINGYFPLFDEEDKKTNENVWLRNEYETNNISDQIAHFLNYSKNDYKDWGKNSLNNIVLETSKFANAKIFDGKDNTRIKTLSQKKYDFLMLKGPSKYSGVTTDTQTKDTYNSFSPYEFYTAIIGGDWNSKENSYSSQLTLNYLTSSASLSDDASSTSTYNYQSSIQKTIAKDNDKVLNNLFELPKSNVNAPFPSWGIVLIILGTIFALVFISYFGYRNYKIKEWTKKEKSKNNPFNKVA